MAAAIHAGDVRLLADIGFMALWSGRLREAAVIFEGVNSARPGGEAGRIGLAMLLMAENRLTEAVSLLRAQRRSIAARTFLGFALARLGDISHARKAWQSVIERARETPFAALAEAGLREFPAR